MEKLAVVLTGKSLPQQQTKAVWTAAAKLFKLEPDAFKARVLARCPVTIRETTDNAEARRIFHTLVECGAQAELVESDGGKWNIQAEGRICGPVPLAYLRQEHQAGRLAGALEVKKIADQQWTTLADALGEPPLTLDVPEPIMRRLDNDESRLSFPRKSSPREEPSSPASPTAAHTAEQVRRSHGKIYLTVGVAVLIAFAAIAWLATPSAPASRPNGTTSSNLQEQRLFKTDSNGVITGVDHLDSLVKSNVTMWTDSPKGSNVLGFYMNLLNGVATTCSFNEPNGLQRFCTESKEVGFLPGPGMDCVGPLPNGSAKISDDNAFLKFVICSIKLDMPSVDGRVLKSGSVVAIVCVQPSLTADCSDGKLNQYFLRLDSPKGSIAIGKAQTSVQPTSNSIPDVATPKLAAQAPAPQAAATESSLSSGIGPSFDCRKASTTTENAICNSPELSDLDGQLGVAYSNAIAITPSDQLRAVRADQASWIKNRDVTCNGETTCLASYLRQRIEELKLNKIIQSASPKESSPPTTVSRAPQAVQRDTGGNYSCAGLDKVIAEQTRRANDASSPMNAAISAHIASRIQKVKAIEQGFGNCLHPAHVTDQPSPPSTMPTSMGRQSQPADTLASIDKAYSPKYPPQAVREHHEGKVSLKVLVGRDGKAIDLAIESSSGYDELDQAAIATVQTWTFNPAQKNGNPVESYVRVPVDFNLRN